MASKLILGGGVAVVTGAASGIGKETALAFAEAQVKHVVFCDTNEEGAKAAAEASKASAKNPEYTAMVLHVDVTDEASVQAMVDKTLKACKRIDYFVNCAGILRMDSLAPTPDTNIEVFDNVMNVNMRGTMLCLRAVSKAMVAQEPLGEHTGRAGPRSLGRGSIVCMSSLAAYQCVRGMIAYGGSKAAVLNMVKIAASDNMAHGIRVNAVCPGGVDTPMISSSFEGLPPGSKEAATKGLPWGRMAAPEEIADYIVFLCSGSATYITGTGLVIDGGMTATQPAS